VTERERLDGIFLVKTMAHTYGAEICSFSDNPNKVINIADVGLEYEDRNKEFSLLKKKYNVSYGL
jgi:hypothetical protein